MCAAAGCRLADVGYFGHGTTVATNIVLEHKGAEVGMITTEGFRDLVEIGLEDRFAQYDVFLQKPAPLVPRQWRHGVTERSDASGRTITPLDEAQVVALARRLQADGIESVAVCFLHGYAHPAHERRVRELMQQHAPGLWVSLASDVCPEIREYERFATTVANAYLAPRVARCGELKPRRSCTSGARRLRCSVTMSLKARAASLLMFFSRISAEIGMNFI